MVEVMTWQVSTFFNSGVRGSLEASLHSIFECHEILVSLNLRRLAFTWQITLLCLHSVCLIRKTQISGRRIPSKGLAARRSQALVLSPNMGERVVSPAPVVSWTVRWVLSFEHFS